jgi:5'(3')-deoxyribonucleotidase
MRLFIDLDGVVGDWVGQACKTFKIDRTDPAVHDLLKHELGIRRLIDDRDMWKTINSLGAKWWDDIQLFPWSHTLVSRLKEVGNVCFLTSPSFSASAAAGKMTWLPRNFPNTPFIITRYKEFCAGPDSILIDDHVSNIERFEAAGGHGFHFPNSEHLLNPQTDLKIEHVIDSILNDIREISSSQKITT